jgi:hypothetical protein
MTQAQFTASRKQRNGNTLTVTFIGSSRSDKQQAFQLDIDMAQVKKQTKTTGNYLPGRFKAEGLPFKVEFVVDIWKPANYPKTGAEMRITEMQITDMQNEALTSHNLPVDELRRLAIQASSFLAVVSPATKGNPFGDDFTILGHAGTPRHTLEAFAGVTKLELKGKELYEASCTKAPHTDKSSKQLQRILVWVSTGRKNIFALANSCTQSFLVYRTMPARKRKQQTQKQKQRGIENE